MAPPSGTASRPSRALVALAVLIVALFLAIVGGDVVNPAAWKHDFQVKLGLDLTSGTTVTLKAVTPKGTPPKSAEMATAVSILRNRVNASGFTEASVDQQGSDIINVSVPGKNAQQVTKLTQAAQLQFRQVLLQAPNTASPVPSPASGTPSPGSSPSAGTTPSASASPSATTKAKVSSPGTGIHLTAATAGNPSPSASASPSPSASATPSANGTSTWQQASGNAAAVSPQVKALFDKLNCANKNWQQQVGYGQGQFNKPDIQTVSCGSLGGVTYKFALDVAKVTGKDISSANATADQTDNYWAVNLGFKSAGAKAWGDLTTKMYDEYHGSQNPNDSIAVVLDGNTMSFPTVQGAQPSGNSQITGNFSQSEATNLANLLSYGALPLSFNQQSVNSVSPQLGHDQLSAGLIAAAIGLLLVVAYSLLYYRGMAVVSVFSLVIAGVVAWLSVIMLGKYQGYALSLAGIAGLVVAIGITADSFVVYFERLRDEVREGRSLRSAVERGWVRARRTILVSDTVSFLAAALLYFLSVDQVKGFAFTLGLTTVIDVVVVFLFTKPMMTLLARTKFFGQGHRLSGLDPARLGARAPWRSSRVQRPGQLRTARTAPAKEA